MGEKTEEKKKAENGKIQSTSNGRRAGEIKWQVLHICQIQKPLHTENTAQGRFSAIQKSPTYRNYLPLPNKTKNNKMGRPGGTVG